MKHSLSTRTASSFLLATALAVSGAAFAEHPETSEPQHAEDHHSGDHHSSTELHARLTDAAATVGAEAEYKSKTTGAKFEGSVRVSLPNAYNIIDQASAGAAQVVLTLTHPADAAPYAECTLALRSFRANTHGASSASYRVAASNTTGVLIETPTGASCDDLTSGTPTPAVPAVQSGDAIALTINAIPVAAGTVH